MATSLELTLGAIEVGSFISFLLFGIFAAQCYTYYQSGFTHDSRLIKTMIQISIVTEVVHTAFIMAFIYISTIKAFAHPEELVVPHWTLGFSIPVGNIVVVMTQAFFAYRIWVLSKSYFIVGLSWTLSFCRLVGAFAIAITQHIVGKLATFDEDFLWLIITFISIGVAVDILNTTALTYYLYRSRGDITGSRKVVETLILWTIETGLLTTIGNTTALILLVSLPGTTVFLSVTVFLTKMYSNSLLASLNGRLTLRSTGVHATKTLCGAHPIHSSSSSNQSTSRLAGQQPVQLGVVVSTVIDRENSSASGFPDYSRSKTFDVESHFDM